MKYIILSLLLATGAWGAFTDGLTVNSKIAFVGDSWTSNSETPAGVGGANYHVWADSGNYAQSAEWANKLCDDVGWRNFRVFATGGAQVRYDGTGIAQYIPDVLEWEPDLTFFLGGINDCADASDLTTAVSISETVVDSVDVIVDRLIDNGSKVCLMWLHPCSNYYHYKADVDDTLRWDQYKETCRLNINSDYATLHTEDDDYHYHTDYWIQDTLGQFSGTSIDSTVIDPTYNNDDIHLNMLGNYIRADSLWVYALNSLTFDKTSVTYYVNRSIGHDWTNLGLTAASPFATLQAALNHVRPGDRIKFSGDTVDVDDVTEPVLRFRRYGRAGAAISIDFNGAGFFDPHDSNTKLIYPIVADSSYYDYDSLLYYTISNASFYNRTGYPIYLWDRGGLTIDNCDIYGQTTNFLDSKSDTIRNCTIYGNTGTNYAIRTSGNTDLFIYHNTFYASEDYVSNYFMNLAQTGGDLIISSNSFLGEYYESTSSRLIYATSSFAPDIFYIVNNLYRCNSTGVGRGYHLSDATVAPPLVFANNVTYQARNYPALFLDDYPDTSGGNFVSGGSPYFAYVASGYRTLAAWRTGTGVDYDWGYDPAVMDTLKYGGYPVSKGVVPRTHNWCSVGPVQYSGPSVPETFSLLQDADSLITTLTWSWDIGDTIDFDVDDGADLYELINYVQDSDSLHLDVDASFSGGGFGGGWK